MITESLTSYISLSNRFAIQRVWVVTIPFRFGTKKQNFIASTPSGHRVNSTDAKLTIYSSPWAISACDAIKMCIVCWPNDQPSSTTTWGARTVEWNSNRCVAATTTSLNNNNEITNRERQRYTKEPKEIHPRSSLTIIVQNDNKSHKASKWAGGGGGGGGGMK